MSHHSLPVSAVAVHTAQEFSEHPWANIAHAAHDHLIRPRAYLCNAADKQAARTWLFNQRCQVIGPITNQWHHIARERGVDKLAVAVSVDFRRFKVEEKIVAVISILAFTLHAECAKGFGLAITEIKRRTPNLLNGATRLLGNIFAASEE